MSPDFDATVSIDTQIGGSRFDQIAADLGDPIEEAMARRFSGLYTPPQTPSYFGDIDLSTTYGYAVQARIAAAAPDIPTEPVGLPVLSNAGLVPWRAAGASGGGYGPPGGPAAGVAGGFDDGMPPGGYNPLALDNGFGEGSYGGSGGYGRGPSGGRGGPPPGWDGQSVNARWRAWQQGQQQEQDFWDNSTGVEEARYADIIDVPGRSYDAGWRGSVARYVDRTRDGLKEFMDSKEAGWALGYGGSMMIGNAQRALSPLVSGDVYLPDQVAEQAGTSLLPLVGSVVGTVAGARFGAGGAMGGQFIGQAVGQSAEDLIDQYATGHTFAEEKTGAALGSGRGGADAIQEFVDALKNAATPAIKELADTLTQVGRTGMVAPSAAGEFGQFQSQLGTDFARAETGVQRFLDSSPFFSGQRQTFGTHPMSGLSSNDYYGEAAAAAASGDYDAMQQSLAFAGAGQTRSAENPAWKRDTDFVDRYSKNAGFLQDVKDFFTWDGGQQSAYEAAQERLGNVGPGGKHVPGSEEEPQFLPGMVAPDSKKTQEEIEKQFYTFQKDQAGVASAAAVLGADQGRLTATLLRGGGSAAMRGALSGLEADAEDGVSSLQTDIATLRGDEKQYPSFKAFYESQINADIQRQQDMRAEPLRVQQAATGAEIGEDEAGFGLFELQHRLAGDSASKMLPGYRRRATQILTESTLPGLSPAQRYGLQQDALETVYDAKMSAYGQTLEGIDLKTSVATEGVDRAQRDGGPSDVFRAGQAVVEAYTAKVKELTEELNRGGLTFDDRIAKERQLSDARRQSAAYDDANREGLYTGNAAVFGTQRAFDAAGNARAVRLGGNRAFDAGVLSDDLNLETNAQAKLDYDRRAHPDNPGLIAGDRLGVAQAQEGRLADLEGQHTWSPDAGTQEADINARSAYRRSLIAPYTDSGGDPFNRAGEVIGVLGREGASLEANFRRSLAADGRIADPRMRRQATDADTLDYTRQRAGIQDQLAQMEHDRYFAENVGVTEMIAGSPGGGVGAALIPRAALSALYEPGPRNGTWAGVPAVGHGPAASPYQSGGGAIEKLLGAASAAGGGNEQTRVLVEILQELKSQGRTGSRAGGPVAPRDPVGPAGRALGFGYNSNTGR